jgi:hypothetical protein
MSWKYLIFILFLLSGVFFHAVSCAQGVCATQTTVITKGADATEFYAPTNLIARVLSADFVIVTNMMPASKEIGEPCYGISISGRELVELKKAISALRAPARPQIYSGPGDLSLLFFRGTNCVAKATIGDEWVYCEEGQFVDHTGFAVKRTAEGEKWVLDVYDKWLSERVLRNTALSRAGIH